jgi:hypothetical protein
VIRLAARLVAVLSRRLVRRLTRKHAQCLRRIEALERSLELLSAEAASAERWRPPPEPAKPASPTYGAGGGGGAAVLWWYEGRYGEYPVMKRVEASAAAVKEAEEAQASIERRIEKLERRVHAV